MGAGATKRLSAVRWGVAGNIVFAWVLTIPAAALVAAADVVPGARRSSDEARVRTRKRGRCSSCSRQAGEAVLDVARAVEQRFREWPAGPSQEEVKELEHDGRPHRLRAARRSNAQFVTPYDRQDIVTLAFAVDEVADKIENASELLGLYGVETPTRQSLELCALLVQATERARAAARRPARASAAAAARDPRDQGDRGRGRRRRARGARGLFKDDRIDPMIVIRWKDIYEALEDAVDACETAATASATSSSRTRSMQKRSAE